MATQGYCNNAAW